ncbi:DsbA family protein [Halobacteriovorax sp.]|uniref:DsbA family protein n=1 Tax=Halobacteriovorax sp. TaxID=2020862 RepID=UPI003AF30B44
MLSSNKTFNFSILLVLVALFLASCSNKNSAQDIRKALEDDPTILTDVMKKNPQVFMETLQQIASEMKQQALADRNRKEKEILEDAFKNPIQVQSHSDDLIIGNPNAKVKIYEYSDFQCPFCFRALETVKQLMDEYGKDVAFIYRHLPIDSIHPQARLAAQYYEAIRIKHGKKAFKFHETILHNQAKIRLGEKYLLEVVKKMGLDTKEIKKLANSKQVDDKIAFDIESANKLGFSGTPGFVVGGVPVKGAYPYAHFKKIIDRLLENKTADTK